MLVYCKEAPLPIRELFNTGIVAGELHNENKASWECEDEKNCNLRIDSTYDIWIRDNYQLKINVEDKKEGIEGDITLTVKNVEWSVPVSYKYSHVRGVQYGRYGSDYYSCDGSVYTDCTNNNDNDNKYFKNGAGETYPESPNDGFIKVAAEYSAFQTDSSWFVVPHEGRCACAPGYDDVWFCIGRAMTYDIEDGVIASGTIGKVSGYKCTIEIDAFGQKYTASLDQSSTDDVNIDVSGFGNIRINGMDDIRSDIEGKFILRLLKGSMANNTFAVEHTDDIMIADSVPDLGIIPSEGFGKYQIVEIGGKDLLYDKKVLKDFSFNDCYDTVSKKLNTDVDDYIMSLYERNKLQSSSLGMNAKKGELTGSCCITITSSSKNELITILSNFYKLKEKYADLGYKNGGAVNIISNNAIDFSDMKFGNIAKVKTSIHIISNDINAKPIINYSPVGKVDISNITVFTASTGSFVNMSVITTSSDIYGRVKVSSDDAIFNLNYVTVEPNVNTSFILAIINNTNKDTYKICAGTNNICVSHSVYRSEPINGGTDDPDSNHDNGQGEKEKFTAFLSYMYTGIISSILCTLIFLLLAIIAIIFCFTFFEVLKKFFGIILLLLTCGKINYTDAQINNRMYFPKEDLNITSSIRANLFEKCDFSDEVGYKLLGILSDINPYLVIRYSDYIKDDKTWESQFTDNKISLAAGSGKYTGYCMTINKNNAFNKIGKQSRLTISTEDALKFNIELFDGCGWTSNGFSHSYSLDNWWNDKKYSYDGVYGDDRETSLQDHILQFFDYDNMMQRLTSLGSKVSNCFIYKNDAALDIVLAVSEKEWGKDNLDVMYDTKYLLISKSPVGIDLKVSGTKKVKVNGEDILEVIIAIRGGTKDSVITEIVKNTIKTSGDATIIHSSPPDVGLQLSNFRTVYSIRAIVICKGICKITVSDDLINIQDGGKVLKVANNKGLLKNRRISSLKSNATIIYNKHIGYTYELIGNSKHYRYSAHDTLKLLGNFYFGNLLRENEDGRRSEKSYRQSEIKSKYYEKKDTLQLLLRDSRYSSILKSGMLMNLVADTLIIDNSIFKVKLGNTIRAECDNTNGTLILCNTEFGYALLNNTNKKYITDIKRYNEISMELKLFVSTNSKIIMLDIDDSEVLGSLYWNTDGGLSCVGGPCIVKTNQTGSWRIYEENNELITDIFDDGDKKKKGSSHLIKMLTKREIKQGIIKESDGCNRCGFMCMMSCAKLKMTNSYNWFFWSPIYSIAILLIISLIVTILDIILVSGFKNGSKSLVVGSYKKLKKYGTLLGKGGYNITFRRKTRNVNYPQKEGTENRSIYRPLVKLNKSNKYV